MACASCGSPNLPVARFCARCGQPLAGSLSPETVSGGSRGHNAAHIAQEPDVSVSSLEHRPPPSLFKEPKAGLWQRAVMGLAALVVMTLAIPAGGSVYAAPWVALVVPIGLAGLGLGLAAVRPPRGVLRRILVALGALVILVVAGGSITIFVGLYYFFSWD